VSDSFVFSKILILNSITNPNINPVDYLDAQSPFSFFDYIKYAQTDLSPVQINNFYTQYLNEWNLVKQNSAKVTQDTIRDRYIELLKEIAINYTTIEEKRFLSNIDFNNETELDIILPFYSKKIIDICDFYKSKREKLKFKIERNKTKGNFNSIQTSIYETITDVIFSDYLNVGTYQPLINYKDLIKNLDIELEELYDLYTNYLDNDPSETYETYEVKTKLRQDLYTANLNKIDAFIFINLDEAIKAQILESVKMFLVEFGRLFTINYNINSIDLNCKPNDALYNLITNNKPKASRLVDLKNLLIKKYIGTDFYYIATGSTITDMTSALLFKADNPTGNLLNRHFPTTASIEEESDLQSFRRIGLFFTPDKNSILYYSVPEKKYKIDTSKLEPNKLYIYPDPNLYGNTIGLTKKYDTEYPLIHIVDYTKSVKGVDYGFAAGDINNTPYTQDFYAYFSKNQINNNIYLGKEGLKTNFSSLYNKGVITKWATDIFGNQFALYKEKSKKNILYTSFYISESSIVCEEYDGGGIKFDSTDSGYLPETTFASNSSWVLKNIWDSYYYYNILIEGGVGKIVNGILNRATYVEDLIVDGLMVDESKWLIQPFDIDINRLYYKDLTLVEGNLFNLLDDTLDRDKVTYSWDINDTTVHTLSYEIDGLSYTRNPYNIKSIYPNVLDGNPLGNRSQNKPNLSNNYILSSIQYKDFDAGFINDVCEEEYDFEEQTKFIIKQTIHKNRTIIDNSVNDDNLNSYELRNSFGSLYVKNVVTQNISPLLSALESQFINKYPENILEELRNKILDFNIYNNFIWIKTQNYIIFDVIVFENNEFTYSGTNLSYINYGNNVYLDNISNPFIFENRNYGMIVQLSAINTISNNFSIIPIIYKIDYQTASKTKVFPQENTNTSIFNNDTTKNDIKLCKINKVNLIYNTRNNRYAITTTVEDQNEMCYLVQIKFNYDTVSVSDLDVKFYNFTGIEYIKTINFYDYSDIADISDITFNDISTNNNILLSEDTLILS
jgi:hypothetical protein